jgi:hypothetical protein
MHRAQHRDGFESTAQSGWRVIGRLVETGKGRKEVNDGESRSHDPELSSRAHVCCRQRVGLGFGAKLGGEIPVARVLFKGVVRCNLEGSVSL